MRTIGWVGLIFCTIGLLVDLAAYDNLSVGGAGAELMESLRTLFWGMALFPLGGVLSWVLLQRSKKESDL
jgi:hypothetical protein